MTPPDDVMGATEAAALLAALPPHRECATCGAIAPATRREGGR